METFTSVDAVYVAGRGQIYVVELPRDYADFSSVAGKDVSIDGTVMHCRDVEILKHFDFEPPYKAGKRVGLQVREI